MKIGRSVRGFLAKALRGTSKCGNHKSLALPFPDLSCAHRASTVPRLHLLRLLESLSSKPDNIYQVLSMNLMVSLIPVSIFYLGPQYQEQYVFFFHFQFARLPLTFCDLFCFARGPGINVLHLCFSNGSSSFLTQIFSSQRDRLWSIKPNVLSSYLWPCNPCPHPHKNKMERAKIPQMKFC